MACKHSILVATDLSERSALAVQRGFQVAQGCGTSLTIFHVVDLDLFSASSLTEHERHKKTSAIKWEVQALINEMDRDPSVSWDTEVVDGEPVEMIVEKTQKEGYELVVMGDHGEHHFRDFILGTTARNVITQSHIPILVVKNPTEGPYRRILLPTDFSQRSKECIQFVFKRFPDARYYLTHIYEMPSELRLKFYDISDQEITEIQNTIKEKAEKALQEFAATLPTEGIDITAEAASGSMPDNTIMRIADGWGADLIAMGSTGTSGLGKVLLGSVTEQVLRSATSDVLAYVPIEE